MKKIDIKQTGIPNVCFSLTDKDDKREPEYKKQRIERGFDDSETWALDATIAEFIIPRLKRFKELTIGHPAHITMDEWYAIIDKMITAFEIAVDSDEIEWNEDEVRVYDEGMKLFSEYFLNLWW